MIPVYVVSDTPTYGASNRPAAISRTRMLPAATKVRTAAAARGQCAPLAWAHNGAMAAPNTLEGTSWRLVRGVRIPEA